MKIRTEVVLFHLAVIGSIQSLKKFKYIVFMKNVKYGLVLIWSDLLRNNLDKM